MEIRTRFADWPRGRLRACLGLALVLLAACLWSAFARDTLPLTEDSERIEPRFLYTAEAEAKLVALGVPGDVLAKLEPIRDVNFASPRLFRARLAELLPAAEYQQYLDVILDAAIQGDLNFYVNIVTRVGSGQSYYDALTDEFTDIDYIPTSVFNWRMPTYAWVIGRWLTPRVAQGLLVAIALVTMLLWYTVIKNELGTVYAPLALVLVGPFAWSALDSIFVFTEVWAGTLIALSIAAYALGNWPVAVVAALAALFFRELTAPYCLLCLGLAVWDRRRLEVVAWVVGLGLFALCYWLHAREVLQHLPEVISGPRQNWVQFGGLPFMIGTSQMNVFLIYFPSWVAAICLPLSLLGLLGWPGRTGLLLLLTACGYLAAFSVLGMPNNAYWGLMNTPLLALGLAALPACIRDMRWALQPHTNDMP